MIPCLFWHESSQSRVANLLIGRCPHSRLVKSKGITTFAERNGNDVSPGKCAARNGTSMTFHWESVLPERDCRRKEGRDGERNGTQETHCKLLKTSS